MSYEDEDYIEDYNIDEYDQSEPLNMNTGNINTGYNFLLKGEIEKERDKKIEEFIQFSSLSKEEAELILINYNWNIDILNNDWFDKMEIIKMNSGLSQTPESIKKISIFFKKNKI
jgi:hypothetical protein